MLLNVRLEITVMTGEGVHFFDSLNSLPYLTVVFK